MIFRLHWQVIRQAHTLLYLLKVGDKDSVGFSIIGEEEVSFGEQVPRGRWVHVAFAAAPKKTSLFFDGKCVAISEKKALLPMATIGDRERGFHGYLQEVRYWTKVLKGDQIKKSMGEILSPPDHPNLIGYWTLEEGEGRYCHDITDYHYRCKFTKSAWNHQYSSGIKSDPPTPAYRERHICKFSLQRYRLAKKHERRVELKKVVGASVCPSSTHSVPSISTGSVETEAPADSRDAH